MQEELKLDGFPDIIFVIGPSGTGKSTVGSELAQRLGAEFLEGDDFHPNANIKKMSRGEPLTTEDRLPWLLELAQAAKIDGKTSVTACSALKKTYRDVIRKEAAGVQFLLLDIQQAITEQRSKERADHFMPSSLVASQFASLEKPDPEEQDVTVLDANQSVEKVIEDAISVLKQVPPKPST